MRANAQACRSALPNHPSVEVNLGPIDIAEAPVVPLRLTE